MYCFFCGHIIGTALEELFTLGHMNESNIKDYFPFPSKIFALMFMLANSPRPIVSIMNMAERKLYIFCISDMRTYHQ